MDGGMDDGWLDLLTAESPSCLFVNSIKLAGSSWIISAIVCRCSSTWLRRSRSVGKSRQRKRLLVPKRRQRQPPPPPLPPPSRPRRRRRCWRISRERMESLNTASQRFPGVAIWAVKYCGFGALWRKYIFLLTPHLSLSQRSLWLKLIFTMWLLPWLRICWTSLGRKLVSRLRSSR